MQRISIGVAKHQGNTLAIPGLYVCNYVPIIWLVVTHMVKKQGFQSTGWITGKGNAEV